MFYFRKYQYVLPMWGSVVSRSHFALPSIILPSAEQLYTWLDVINTRTLSSRLTQVDRKTLNTITGQVIQLTARDLMTLWRLYVKVRFQLGRRCAVKLNLVFTRSNLGGVQQRAGTTLAGEHSDGRDRVFCRGPAAPVNISKVASSTFDSRLFLPWTLHAGPDEVDQGGLQGEQDTCARGIRATSHPVRQNPREFAEVRILPKRLPHCWS